jgi:Pentapeptide repeats (9 copies)
MDEESPAPLSPAEEPAEAEIQLVTKLKSESSIEPSSTKGLFHDCEWLESPFRRGNWIPPVEFFYACDSEPFYKEYEGMRYCVLHYPGKEKGVAFNEAFQKKIVAKDFNFCGVWFPNEVDFVEFDFSANVDFSYAKFSEYAHFGSAKFSANADFRSTTFSKNADFGHARFNKFADFCSVTFNEDADLSHVKFSEYALFDSAVFDGHAYFSYTEFNQHVDFGSAKFSTNVDFSNATFNGVGSFGSAIFNDSVKFFGDANERTLSDGTRIKERSLGKNSSFSFQHARIEKPDRASFHTVALRPHWFVNVDSRKFVFTDVDWEWDVISIEEEIKNLKVSSPHRLLAITCRQLAENAEANNRYEEASRFRYWAMDLARYYKWKGARFWKTDWLHMLYWAVSGYGERILRALGWLVAVWIVFALLYTRVGFIAQTPKPSNENSAATSEDTTGKPLEIQRSLTYSLAVMSLQRPEPRPLTNWAHALVTLEMILGPVQAALLVLAIRRKFMR